MEWVRDRPRGQIRGTAPGFAYEVRPCPGGWRYERVVPPAGSGHRGPVCPSPEEAAAGAEVDWRVSREG
jgi:hypothetical protein